MTDAFKPEQTCEESPKGIKRVIRRLTRTNPKVIELLPAVKAMALSPEGSLLAVAWSDHLIRIVDSKRGGRTRHEINYQGRIGDLRFSPDGRKLAFVESNNENGHRADVVVWDILRDHVVRLDSDAASSESAPSLIGFDPNGRWLATNCCGIRIHDLESGHVTNKLPRDGESPVFCSMPSGNEIFLFDDDKGIEAWDLVTGKARTIASGNMMGVVTAAPNGSGDEIAILSSSGEGVTILSNTGSEVRRHSGSEELVNIRFVSGGSDLIGITPSGAVLKWRKENEEPTLRWSPDDSLSIPICSSISDDGRFTVSGYDGGIAVFRQLTDETADPIT